jgi:hypothetical protein
VQHHATRITKAIQRLEGELGGELIYRELQFTKLNGAWQAGAAASGRNIVGGDDA